jgi:uncharacterized membrane protein
MPNQGDPRASLRLSSRTQITAFSGPLPPPAVLAKYNEVLPGLAERIVALTEQQSAHRQALEAAVTKGNIAAQGRGQWFALVTVLAGMASGVWLVSADKPTAGLTAMLTPLGIVAAGFFIARAQQARDLTRKRGELEEAAE